MRGAAGAFKHRIAEKRKRLILPDESLETVMRKNQLMGLKVDEVDEAACVIHRHRGGRLSLCRVRAGGPQW